MKRLLSYFIIISLLLACGKRPEPVVKPQPLPFFISDTLLRIDSLMQTDADSALAVLLSMPRTANACVGTLLLSEALYKTNNPQYYRDELQTAMRYFDSLAVQYPDNDDVVMLSARSHYMNGVGYYESDSVVDACKEYLRALDIMEDHFEEKDFVGYKAKFMALTYSRLGILYFKNDIAQYSIELYKNALVYFTKSSNKSIANTYRWIGYAYRLNYQNDSAVYYYRKALNLALKQNNSTVYGVVLSEAAPIYYDLGYTDSSFIMIKSSLSIAKSEEQRLVRLFTLGLLLSKEHQYDSAIYCLQQSLKHDDYNTRTASEELLIDCYHALGDTTNELYYKLKLNESLKQFVKAAPRKVKLSSAYEHYKLNKAEKLQKLNNKKKNHNIYIGLSFIALALLLYMVYSWYNHKRKNKTIAAMKQQIEATTFNDETICATILNIVNSNHFKAQMDCTIYSEFALTTQQIMSLRVAVNRHFEGLIRLLNVKYPELTDDDITYCCLYLLDLKDADISALMQRSYTAINDRRRKIKKVFGISNNISDFLRNAATKP